jgi:hypothetical protein
MGDGVALANKAESAGGPKGEYESTAEYQRRIGSVVPSDIAFTIELSRSNTAYNADTGFLDVSLSLTDARPSGYQGNNDDYSKTYPAIVTGGSVKIVGEHQGQNAFGATAKVTEVSAQKVLMVLGEFSGSNAIVGSIKGRIAIPSAAMKASSSDLALRIEGRSSAPYFMTSGEHRDATIYTKQESSTRIYFFRVDPTSVTLVNTKTGATYGALQMIATKY